MEFRTLGRSGLKVPVLSLGTATFGGGSEVFRAIGNSSVAEATRLVDICMEAGVNMFDTADIYHEGISEAVLGQAVAGRRDKVLISTKATFKMGPDPNEVGSSRHHLILACEASLRRMKTDYIDLYQMHGFDALTPVEETLSALNDLVHSGKVRYIGCSNFSDRRRMKTDYIDLYQMHGFDALTPVEETLSALNDLVHSGKVRYIGCSNFSGWHLMKSLAVSERYGWSRYVAHQAYYSLIGREYEWELMPLGVAEGVGCVVWSPLGWGRLTGKLRRNQPLHKESRLHKTAEFGPPVADEYLHKVVDALDAVGQETGKPVAQVALNWLLQRPTVSNVIIGARNEEQLRQNLGAVGWNLTADQVAKLDAASNVTLSYPYWHQRQFAERNPPPTP